MARGDRGCRDTVLFAASAPLSSVGATAPAFLAVPSAPPLATDVSQSSTPSVPAGSGACPPPSVYFRPGSSSAGPRSMNTCKTAPTIRLECSAKQAGSHTRSRLCPGPTARWAADCPGQSSLSGTGVQQPQRFRAAKRHHTLGQHALEVHGIQLGRADETNALISEDGSGSYPGVPSGKHHSSPTSMRWWMRNTRNVALQDTVTGAVSLPGGGRSYSLSVIPSARPRPLSTAPFACIFLSCSIFNSSCIPVFCAALSGAAAALPRRWPRTRFRIRCRRCRSLVPPRRTHAS